MADPARSKKPTPDKRGGAGSRARPAGGRGAKPAARSHAPATKPAAPKPAPRAEKPAPAPRVAPTPAPSAEPLPLGDARLASGTVALLGRPNVGKSTLLNAALETPLAIVSPTPQTTRDTLLGVVHRRVTNEEGPDTFAELLLLDTPGLHKASSALSRSMNRAARGAAQDADVVVFVTDLPPNPDPKRPLTPHRGDIALLKDLAPDQPVVLVVNKIDRLRDKAKLLGLLEALTHVRPFAAVVPVSARKTDGVSRVLDEVARLLPEGPHQHELDVLTDRPSRYFASEYVREQVLLSTREEVPHATAVSVEAWEAKARVARVSATIHVERLGHKKILIGSGGEMLKRIGTAARARLEELVGHPVHLELFVRVTEGWRDTPSLLAELGYGDDRARRGSGPAIADEDEPDVGDQEDQP